MGGRHVRHRPNELFLSHSSRDIAFAKRLAQTIRNHGVAVWFSETDIRGAQQWHDEIGRALNRCDWFALVLSPRSVKSKWVKREILYALNDESYENRIMPIVYEACDHAGLSWTLGMFEHVHFTGGFEEGCRSTLRAWGLGCDPALVTER